jgi:hypothetical protein
MGSCATSRKNIHIIEKKNDIQIFIIRKIKDLIRNNPFMNVNVYNFQKTVISFIPSIQNEQNIENIDIKSFLKSFQLNDLQEKMFIDIIKLSLKKLLNIIEKKNLFDSICYILFYLLCKESEENKIERKKFLYYLLQTSKKDSKDYSSTKLSYLIMHILILLSFALLYLFIGPGILEVNYGFTNENIKSIYIDKVACKDINPKAFSQNVYMKLKEYNSEFNRKTFIIISLNYIFQPFKKYYDMNNSSLSLINAKTNEIDEIINRLDYFFNPNNLLDVLTKMKISEY